MMQPDDFYLGADTHWLGKADVPLMLSHGRLRRAKTLRPAKRKVVIDSRMFTELSQHGRITISPISYVRSLYRYQDEIGLVQWASPQDMMCEPEIIAKTGLSVLEHQRRTAYNLAELRTLAVEEAPLDGTTGLRRPPIHIIAVNQGWLEPDYERGDDLFWDLVGVDLRQEPVVGIGSVCRRQHLGVVRQIMKRMAERGLRTHGFGVKLRGLENYGEYLTSADSFAWSYGARKRTTICPHGVVKWERNCPHFAEDWRNQALAGLARRFDKLGVENVRLDRGSLNLLRFPAQSGRMADKAPAVAA
ncbi:DUF7221 family queuine tRNA-ribosyltransferase-like protein [Micromonospora chalcea]|uniref:deazapurine DNA modification protein DpdA family protein n=1 Tax=Micromonospora chalcea TaxID=1874 RepID=UPI003D75BC47